MSDLNTQVSLPKRKFEYGMSFSVQSYTQSSRKTVTFVDEHDKYTSIDLLPEQAKALASVLLDEPEKISEKVTDAS